jgi:MFS transporter, AAHS family, 4-hydroxybenzoate transporter
VQDEQRIEIAALVENQKLGSYQFLTLALCFLILFVDGLDYSAANVGAPAIIRAFHAEKSAMGLVFGWGNFGILCGSFLFGYIGDRYGRKFGAIAGVLTYSLPAIAIVFADSLEHLMVLRFFAGLGIGGVIPNTVALLTETAPKKYRASFVMLCFVGYSTGTATIGQVAAWLIPIYGWSVVFVTAGSVGTVLGLFLAYALPESIRFVALKEPESPRLRRMVTRLAPNLAIGPQTRFYLQRPPQSEKFRLAQLFAGDLKFVTPLLWIGYFAESLTFMTYASWLSVILESAGLAPQQASLAFSYTAVGGICALLILSRFLDKFGPMATVIPALAAVALIIYLGVAGPSVIAIIAVAVLAMACCQGTHNSFNGTVGSFYPTPIRAKGIGYASGMGRVALITGPVVAGFLLSAHLPLQQLLYVIAGPYLVVACACFGLGRLYQSRFAAGETAVVPETPRDGVAPTAVEGPAQ